MQIEWTMGRRSLSGNVGRRMNTAPDQLALAAIDRRHRLPAVRAMVARCAWSARREGYRDLVAAILATVEATVLADRRRGHATPLERHRRSSPSA